MIGYLLVLLLALPVIDIYLLIEVAGALGFLRMFILVLLTGLIGAHLIRREGVHILMKLQRSVTAGEASRNMIEGALIVISGIFLLTPGFISDIMGVMLVFRPLRERMVAWLMNRAESQFQVRRVEF